MNARSFLLPILTALSLLAHAATSLATNSDQVKKPVAESIRIRQTTQEDEERWRIDKEKLLARFDGLTVSKKQLTERQTTLEERVSSAKARIAAKEKELADSERLQQEISPLIHSLTVELKDFVAGDLPFLVEERATRLERLVELRDNPEVTTSEKFRKVLEALLVEAEYGNTIEVTRETIALDGKDTLVDIFRLGRVALYYQTLDQKSSGYYDVAAKAWKPLTREYTRDLTTAMEIGAKRRPAELLALPLGRLQR
jgi:DNA repair exonuclease SbcCD ATPase subunit